MHGEPWQPPTPVTPSAGSHCAGPRRVWRTRRGFALIWYHAAAAGSLAYPCSSWQESSDRMHDALEAYRGGRGPVTSEGDFGNRRARPPLWSCERPVLLRNANEQTHHPALRAHISVDRAGRGMVRLQHGGEPNSCARYSPSPQDILPATTRAGSDSPPLRIHGPNRLCSPPTERSCSQRKQQGTPLLSDGFTGSGASPASLERDPHRSERSRHRGTTASALPVTLDSGCLLVRESVAGVRSRLAYWHGARPAASRGTLTAILPSTSNFSSGFRYDIWGRRAQPLVCGKEKQGRTDYATQYLDGSSSPA